MSMWMPWMSEWDKDVERTLKAEVEHKTKEEIELEEIRERKANILKLGMLGAETIREFKELEGRESSLLEEAEYVNWFREHENEIKQFFGFMANKFLFQNEKYIEMYYLGTGKEGLKCRDHSNNIIFDAKFLKKLLKRYGYRIEELKGDYGVIKVYYKNN